MMSVTVEYSTRRLLSLYPVRQLFEKNLGGIVPTKGQTSIRLPPPYAEWFKNWQASTVSQHIPIVRCGIYLPRQSLVLIENETRTFLICDTGKCVFIAARCGESDIKRAESMLTHLILIQMASKKISSFSHTDSRVMPEYSIKWSKFKWEEQVGLGKCSNYSLPQLDVSLAGDINMINVLKGSSWKSQMHKCLKEIPSDRNIRLSLRIGVTLFNNSSGCLLASTMNELANQCTNKDVIRTFHPYLDQGEKDTLEMLLGDPEKTRIRYTLSVGDKKALITYRAHVSFVEGEMVVNRVSKHMVREFVFDIFMPGNKNSLRLVFDSFESVSPDACTELEEWLASCYWK
eukprot:TRINITY_DN1346_c0_g1_i21.p1 TRINITY_DN1346_c0_g1~~TRINITY_DN1346_c0_g1_i21.p1  ORF type:complete len:345 (+),score=38.62 TRINITY_DN1346_c0_g1_i21:133-1167(+)